MELEAFKTLIECHRSNMQLRNIDDSTATEALNEALSLASDLILDSEATTEVKFVVNQGPESILTSVRSYVDCVVEPSRKDVPYITAQMGAEVITKLIHCGIKRQRSLVEELLQLLQQLNNAGRLNKKCFVSCVVQQKLPLSLLMPLHDSELLPLPVYVLSNAESELAMDQLAEGIVTALADTRTQDGESCQRLLCTVVLMGLSDSVGSEDTGKFEDTGRACRQLVERITAVMWQRAAHPETHRGSPVPSGAHFRWLRQHEELLGGRQLALAFLCSNLQRLCGPGLDGSLTARQALARHSSWLRQETPPELSALLRNLLEALGMPETVTEMSALAKEGIADWQMLLAAVSSLLTHQQQAPAILRGLVDSTVAAALAAEDEAALCAGLLLARHSCFAPVPAARQAFPSYGAWFGATFCSEAGPRAPTACSAPAAAFLLAVLTRLVPDEPPVCLRVHVNKVPVVPPQCSQMLSDYVSLAKTHLEDLGEASMGGLLGLELAPEEDVAAALDQLERTGQVSRVLLDSTVFRKSQFERQFVPALLLPEPAPTADVTPSSRRLLIAKLRSAGKLPASALRQYDEACQRLTASAAQTSAGAGGRGGAVEGWRSRLQALVEAVCSGGLGTDGRPGPGLRAALDGAQSQLQLLVQWSQSQPEPDSIWRRAVTRLLKAALLCWQPPAPAGLSEGLRWPHRLLGLLEAHLALLQLLRTGLVYTVRDTGQPEHVVKALAALVCAWDTWPGRPRPAGGDIGETVAQELKPTTQQSMLHALWFCGEYQRLVGPEGRQRAPGLAALCGYLQLRLSFSCQPAVAAAASRAGNLPNQPSGTCSTGEPAQSQPLLQRWLELEAAVEPAQDPVQPREAYLQAWLAQHAPAAAPQLLAAAADYLQKGSLSLPRDLLAAVPWLPRPAADADAEPWLLRPLARLALSKPPDYLLRVLLLLPPWLLLADHPADPPRESALCALAQLLHMELRDSLWQPGSSGQLPPPLVRLLLRALETRYSPPARLPALRLLLRLCPDLQLALLAEWPQLKVQLSPLCPGAAAGELWGELRGPDGWAEGLHSAAAPTAAVYRLLDLGRGLLGGSLLLACRAEGAVVAVAVAVATAGSPLPPAQSLPELSLLLQTHANTCLPIIADAAERVPAAMPCQGLAAGGRAGLCLAAAASLLTAAGQPTAGSPAAQRWVQVLRSCVACWLSVGLELPGCPAVLLEPTFLRELQGCCQALADRLL